MDSSEWPPADAHTGTLHYIPPNLSAFEPLKPLVRSTDINTLIWIGGMFDTPLSVSYPLTIAQALPMTWSLVTASLSSAGKSWGVGSIAKDAEDIAKIVAYFKERRPGGKIVIMGHSTGCQDCMEYVVGAKADQRPPVDGVILQAPVSDREALEAQLPKAFMQEANQLALKMCREGHDKDAMPHRLSGPAFGRMAITARRWVDVASPAPDHSGADDYFSSDLPDERLKKTFGKLPPSTPLLILYGGSDDSVPESVDKDALVSRWIKTVEEGGGKVDRLNGSIVPEATHNLNGCPEPVVRDLVKRVEGYIERLDNGEFGAHGSGSRI
jgi:alpha-beta hydrolase superfamily lysophospholipase